jgi:hypothetical protein
MTIRRFLSPDAKCDPVPLRYNRREKDGMYLITVPVRRAVARLKPVLEPKTKQPWYVLRDSRTNRPFFPGSELSCLGTLELELPEPWPKADANYVRETIAKGLALPMEPSDPNASGSSS